MEEDDKVSDVEEDEVVIVIIAPATTVGSSNICTLIFGCRVEHLVTKTMMIMGM